MASCLKILILEDDFINRRLIKKTIEDSGYEVAESVDCVEDAIKCIEQKQIDLAILDINLGKNQANGISFGKYLKENTNTPFIYLTAYGTKDIINSAVETAPSSYLTKPFNTPDLLAAIELAIINNVQHTTPKEILIKVNGLFVPICLDLITYIESQGNYLTVFTEKESFTTRLTIKKIIEQLPNDTFLQIHRAYVVNKNHISSFNKELVTIGNTSITITKKYAKDFWLAYEKLGIN
jgi:DNA-binding LytR/AlgR family response regulator